MAEDYLSQALSKNEDTNFGDDEQVKVLESLTDDEEIQEAKNLIIEQIETDKDTSIENSKDSEPSKEEVTPQSKEESKDDEVKADKEEVKADNEPESNENEDLSDEGDQVKSSKFVLTDEVISSYPEEYRGVLSKYKGKDESEIIKALVNANKLISKRQESNTSEAQIEAESKNQKIPETEEVKSMLDAEIVKRLKSQFEDFPDNLEELNYFLRDKFDENPMSYNNVIKSIENVKDTVNNDYKRVLYLQNNHAQLNQESIKNDVSVIQASLKNEYGISNADKLFDLELKQSRDENGNIVYQNELVESLLLDANGNIDSNVVQYFGQVPVIRRGALAEKFLKAKAKDIILAVRKEASANARKQHTSLMDEAPNTIGTQAGNSSSTKVVKLNQLEQNTDFDSIMATKQALEKQLGI